MKFYLKLSFVVILTIICLSACPTKKASAEKGKPFNLSGEIEIAAPYTDIYTGEKVSNDVVSSLSMLLAHYSSGAYLYLSGFAMRDGVDKLGAFAGRSVETRDITKGLVESAGCGAGISYYPQDRSYYIVYAEANFKKVGKFVPFVYAEVDNPGMDLIYKIGVKTDDLASVARIALEIGGSDAKLLTFVRGTVSKKEPVKIMGINFIPYAMIQKGFGDVAGNEWRFVAGIRIPFGAAEE